MPFKFQLGANRVIQVTFAKSMIVLPTMIMIVMIAIDCHLIPSKIQGYEKGVPGMCRLEIHVFENKSCMIDDPPNHPYAMNDKIDMCTLCRGETRTLLVPPEMAYGEQGVPNVRSLTFAFILTVNIWDFIFTAGIWDFNLTKHLGVNFDQH